MAPFLSMGGTAQSRYERLRSYMLEEPDHRPRVSPAQFDLRRFNRFGLLGLADNVWQRFERTISRSRSFRWRPMTPATAWLACSSCSPGW